MDKRLIWASALALAGCFSSGGGGGGAGSGEGVGVSGSVSGVWQVTVVGQSSSCGSPTGSRSETLDITQSGTSVTATDSDGVPYQGSFVGNRLTWSGSVDEDGGTTTIQLDATVTGNSVSGTASWSWSDGIDSCSGSDSFSGSRISGGPSSGSTAADGAAGDGAPSEGV